MRRRPRGDDGAYAILYALLVVILLGMASIVIDLGLLRADKRDSRSAADNASLAGSADVGRGPWTPLKACTTAWEYALNNLSLTDSGSPCASAVPGPGFAASVAACPGGPSTATGVVEGVTISITWPVPSTSGLLSDPDGEPSSASRAYEPASDGSAPGCDRLGVTITRDRSLGFATVLGVSEGSSYAASVARFDPDGGPADEVAALNVLNRQDCDALVTTGNGKVIVSPTVDNGVVVGPGIVAVESSGKGSCSGGGARAISPTTGNGSLVCASTVQIVTGTECNGLGVIRSHALDPDQDATRAFSEAAVSSGSLKPQPSPENGRKGWDPVTKKYGCHVISASLTGGPCVVDGTNYISRLVSALGGSGAPPLNYDEQSSYLQAFPLGFVPQAALCPGGAGITGTVVLVPGNHYAACTINVKNGGKVIVQGGTLVVQGGIEVASGGCLVVNDTTCTPSLTAAGTSAVSTTTANSLDALVYLRGTTGCPSSGCFDMSGTLVMPKTFVYSASSAAGINVSSSSFTLWTAPGAGPVTLGRTALENLCFDGANVSDTCLNSRFSRLTYWSEFASPKNPGPNNFGGQGSLSVVGVFFTPRAYFNFTGGGAYTAAAAQFWADVINVNGGAFLGLRPDARFSIATPTSRVQLVR